MRRRFSRAFLSGLIGSFLPTMLGLLLLLLVPIWSMQQIDSLHRGIEEQLLPTHEAMQRIINRTHRLQVDASIYPFRLDPQLVKRYRDDVKEWLESAKKVPVRPLSPHGLVTWEAGIGDMQTWIRKYGDATIQNGEMNTFSDGEVVFQSGLKQMNLALNDINRQVDTRRDEVREWERGAISTTGGLAIVCLLLVLFSWRNAVALQRALTAASRNSERLEVAVKETNHRVKNNLQTIGALIDMNRQEYGAQVPARVLDDIYQQVRTVAAVHDFLSHENHASRVAVRPMLEKLVHLAAAAKDLAVEVESMETELPVKEATSIALIVNELVLNAGKHGASSVKVHFGMAPIEAVKSSLAANNILSYPQSTTEPSDPVNTLPDPSADTSGTTHTVGSGQACCLLTVSDNGPGLPVGFSVAHNGNLGTNLIETLVMHDLRGHVEWTNGQESEGAAIRLCFPAPRCS